MFDDLTLADIDRDGAIRETHHDAMQDTRAGFLRKGALGIGAIAGGSTLLGALAPSAMAAGTGRPPAKFGAGDIGILNYALTLEYLEAAFYNEATAKLRGKLDRTTAAFLKVVTRDENAHVAYLRKGLGTKAVKKPRFDFQGTTSSVAKFKATASVLENTGVHAYLGQAANIKDPKYLLAAGSILTIEARHAAVINHINGKSITPDGPFDTPLTAAQVLKAVSDTRFIVG